MHQQTRTLLHWKIVLDDIDGLTFIGVERGSVQTGFLTCVLNIAREGSSSKFDGEILSQYMGGA